MESKLDELKAKALDLLKACQDKETQEEACAAVKDKLVGLLGDVKKLTAEEKPKFEEVAEKIRGQVVSFMEKDLNALEAQAAAKVKEALDEKSLQDTKVFFLGKKGKLTAILRSMKDLSAEQRPVIGALANKVREDVEASSTN